MKKNLKECFWIPVIHGSFKSQNNENRVHLGLRFRDTQMFLKTSRVMFES